MSLEVPLSLQPMEAISVDDLPNGKGWLFEPKYDGFRCLLFRHGATVSLQSRRQRPLGRYFPEIISAAAELPIESFVFDGELIISDRPFDTLQLRLHPAASRIALLSRQHPAQILVFDLLATSLAARCWISRSATAAQHLKLPLGSSGATGALSYPGPPRRGPPLVVGSNVWAMA